MSKTMAIQAEYPAKTDAFYREQPGQSCSSTDLHSHYSMTQLARYWNPRYIIIYIISAGIEVCSDYIRLWDIRSELNKQGHRRGS